MAKLTVAPGPIPEFSEKAVDTPNEDGPAAGNPGSARWKLFIDGSFNLRGSEAGLVLVSPDQFKTRQALRFNFKASNNEAEYEALIAGLGLARELEVQDIEVFSDSMLIVNQVMGEFQAKEKRMAKYLEKEKILLGQFMSQLITRIPRSENI